MQVIIFEVGLVGGRVILYEWRGGGKLRASKIVFSILPLTIHAARSLSCTAGVQVTIGVLITFGALIICFVRGTPRVTLMEAILEKREVFRVIWVPRSPINWAPTAPTADTGSILACQ